MGRYKHEGLVRQLFKRFSGRAKTAEDREDLLQTIRIMVLETEKTYKKEKGAFTTYCNTVIWRDLVNMYAKQDRLRKHKLKHDCRMEIRRVELHGGSCSQDSMLRIDLQRGFALLPSTAKRVLKRRLTHGEMDASVRRNLRNIKKQLDI